MKFLFICTHNRCRSILSESMTNALAGGRIQAFSAGSQPVGEVHPLTLKYLAARGYPTRGLQSQSWHEFEAKKPDVVITVCDSAANEACPLWFDEGVKVHWGLRDPSKIEGSEYEQQAAFFSVMDLIQARVEACLALNLETMPRANRLSALETIARNTTA